jgi:hypothetical protein
MGRDVVLSVTADGWNVWGEHFVRRQPLARIQHTIGAHPSVNQAKAAILRAIGAAGATGRVIINVGHGAGGGALPAISGKFELAPANVMTIGGRDVNNVFVDVFYDVNLTGPPAMSDMENDLKNNPNSPRLARWSVYQEISRAFKSSGVREVVLLTCRVGNSTEFLRKVANDWGTVIRAYRQRVALTEDITTVGRTVTRRFFMHLENNPPAGKSAADLIVLEEEIPFAPADTFLVGPPLSP